jgi:glycosyltransferase involved in cell wall biosynthesis
VSVLREVFERADAIIVLGEYWRGFIARFYGMAPERFAVVANGVADFAPAAPSLGSGDAPVHILFAGNLTEAKGARVLLEALALLPENLPPWQATFAGTGDVEAFRTRARQLTLSDRVKFPGWVSRNTILPLYRAAEIVVLPSRNEVLPVCLIEGACAGAALIATPVGSIPDVLLPGVNGLTINPDDPEGLALALARLIGDAPLRNAFRAASRGVYNAHFRLEDMIAALRGVYRDALATRR